MTNYEKVRAACIKANPKLMELSFGCKVKFKTGPTERIIRTHGSTHTGATVLSFDTTDTKQVIWEEVDKILGHEPQLSDVLMAMLAKRSRVFYPADLATTVAVQKEWQANVLQLTLQLWNLTKPLKEQSEEILTFLANLL